LKNGAFPVENRTKTLFKSTATLALIFLGAGCGNDEGRQPSSDSERTDRSTLSIGSGPESTTEVETIGAELDAILNEEPQRFLDRCKTLIESGSSDQVRSVALRKRAEYYKQSNMPKEAACDSLRLLSLPLKSTPESSTRRKALASTRAAGLVLESGILEALCTEEPPGLPSGRVSQVAAAISEDLGIAPPQESDAIGNSTTASRLSQEYLRLTPDLGEMREIPMEAASPAERVLLWGRCTALAIDRLPTKEALEYVKQFADEVGIALQTEGNAFCQRESVCFSALGVLRLLSRRLFATTFAGEWLEDSSALGNSELVGLLKRVGRCDMELAVRLAECAPSFDEFAFAALDRCQVFLAVTNDRQERMRSYEYVVSHLPRSERTPGYIVKWAEFCKDVLGLKNRSVEILERVFNVYPESPVAEQARLNHGLTLYEEEKYEEAYLSLQELLVKSATCSYAAAGQYVSALCESAMGLEEDAEAHMFQIAENHPASQVAPRAYFWLGSKALSKMDYERAAEIFDELLVRYPDASVTQEAKNISTKLRASQDLNRGR